MNYSLQIEKDCVALITLPDRSFTAFTEALSELHVKLGNQKIFFMQSIDKKDKPFQVLIVFNVFENL